MVCPSIDKVESRDSNSAGLPVRAATSQSKVDEAVAQSAEEIASGITAATDFLSVLFAERQICHLGVRGQCSLFGDFNVANRA